MLKKIRKWLRNGLIYAVVLANMAGIVFPPLQGFAEETEAFPTTVVNGDFEDGLNGWTLQSGEVGEVSADEKYWTHQYDNRYFYQHGTSFLKGESKETVSGGTLRSSTFVLSGDGYISFMIGAASSESKGSVKLYMEDGTLVKTYNNSQWSDPATGLTLIRVYDQLEDYIGEKLYFVVENGTDTSSFAFINVDDFRASMTREDVIALQREELARIEAVEDLYKAEIVQAYKNCMIIEMTNLTSQPPASIVRTEGTVIDLENLIAASTKAVSCKTGAEVPVAVTIDSVELDGTAVSEDFSSLSLVTGVYAVAYTLTYGEVTEQKTLTIQVGSMDDVDYQIVNGDFETGDLTGWTLLDGSEASENDVGVISADEKYWTESFSNRYFYKQGTYFLKGESKEATVGGAIRSSDFILGGDGYISFLIGAASAESKGSVRLYKADGTLVKAYTNTQWSDPTTGLTLIRVYDQLQAHIGEQMYFVVENGADTSGFAFINVDDFRTSLTKDEVISLQRAELARVEAVEDLYKAEIVQAYKDNIILDTAAIVEEISATVKKYAGITIDVPKLITSATKVQYEISGKAVAFSVAVNAVTKNGTAVGGDFSKFTPEEGTYTVQYTISFDGNSVAKSFSIEVQSLNVSENEVVNGGFETGDLTGWEILDESVWTAEDGVYLGVVSEETYWSEKLPYNQEGSYHLNGWAVNADESITWAIRSSMFTLGGSGWISVRMGGNAAQVKVYTADGTQIGVFNQGRFNDTNFPYVGQGGSWADMGTSFIDLHEYVGQVLYIELCEKTVSSWGVAFFDDVKCYYETQPDIANGYDVVQAPVKAVSGAGTESDPYVYAYEDVRLPWVELHRPSDKVIYLPFEDSGFNVANKWGSQSGHLASVFENPVYQDEAVEPYRPDGILGNAQNFDGYSNFVTFNGEINGSKLTIDAYVCPRVYPWSAPQESRDIHVAQVFAGSYNTGARAGFLFGVSKHGYLTFRVGTGTNWYSLVGNADCTLPTYEWSRVTAVFDGEAGVMSLYLNGKPAGSMQIQKGSEIVASGNQIYIGKGSEAIYATGEGVFDKTHFSGLMDELTITLSAKTAEEIATNGYELPVITYEEAMTPDSALWGDYFRPTYHAVPSGNWMNEPHALFQYNGKWHLFYQFAPAGPYWHNISWGHWVSDDMVNWKFVKEAVIPTENTISPDGVWTGNVIFSSDGYPLLLITAGDDSRTQNGSNQHVGLARAVDYSDPSLTEWEIIGYAVAQTSEMGAAGEFRDAQCFGIGNERYMVVGGKIDGKGAGHIFKTTAKTLAQWEQDCGNGSLNGMNWEYKGNIMGDFFNTHAYNGNYGQVWEMPNIVPLKYADGTDSGKYLFSFTPQHGDWNAWYYIGDFNTDTCQFTPDFVDAKRMDFGDKVFTGATVYLNPSDGKVYVCSIMQDAGRSFTERKNAGWAFYAGLPRELFLHKDGSLGITNIDTSAIEDSTIVSFDDLTIDKANEALGAVASETLKIEFTFTGSASRLGFKLKKIDGNYVEMSLTNSVLQLGNDSGSYVRGETVKGVIYIDKCSIEVYVDDRAAISATKYIRGTGLEVFAEGDATCSVTVTQMKTIHEAPEEPHTHEYASSVTTAASCTTTGVLTYTCSGCGDSYTETIPATGHNYADGVCTACGAADPDYVEPVTVPALTLVAPTLNFEDEIYYNIYYTVSDMSDVVEMGLITFNQSTLDGTIENADAVVSGHIQVGTEYMSHSNGIPAKMLGDALYFKAYAKLSDGTYAYSSMAGYHAVAYAKDMLDNSSNTKMKALVVAMLNYGAAAQVHFDYKADNLMNSFLTAEQQALIEGYSPDMVADLVTVDSAKVGSFKAVSGGYSALAPNVVFEGAFAINFYFTPAKAMDGELKLYYWTLDDYNAAKTLTAENASGVVTTTETSTAGQYVGAITGIDAKQIDQTVFFTAVYESNGVSYCTGVFSYSLASYCLDRITNGSATMQEFAKATVVYGYYAKVYFA